MKDTTKKTIITVSVKLIISAAIQLAIFFIYRSMDKGSLELSELCFYAIISAAVLVLTLFLKINPQYWLVSIILLDILFGSIPTGGLFPGFEKLGLIFDFMAIAIFELLTSIIAVSIKVFVLHIRCRNKIKLIISDNECASVKKVYDENGVVHSFFLYNKIRKCCAAALDEEKIKGKAEVSLTIVGNEEIRELNREHRQKDSATDVLSFPLSENGEFDIDPETNRIMLGDIVISAERAAEQAKEYGHSFEREMCFLATHSMFHLLGYDHEISEEEEKIMFDKQKKVLTKVGINR